MTRRILARRKPGIYNPNAPFWKGIRCEQVVAARVAERKAKLKPRRKSAKA
jgi:hypothetical protein